MPRPRFPSDEARLKRRPGVHVHYSARNHPTYLGVFAKPELRGMLLGLWMIAGERHAAKTGDRVTLTLGDIIWLTGRAHRTHAERALRRLCTRMKYEMSERGEEYEIY